jgi:hypothetical protein
LVDERKPEFEDSWEDLATLMEQFPDHHLEDKVIVQGGRDVAGLNASRPRFGKVYVRRPKQVLAVPDVTPSRML